MSEKAKCNILDSKCKNATKVWDRLIQKGSVREKNVPLALAFREEYSYQLFENPKHPDRLGRIFTGKSKNTDLKRPDFYEYYKIIVEELAPIYYVRTTNGTKLYLWKIKQRNRVYSLADWVGVVSWVLKGETPTRSPAPNSALSMAGYYKRVYGAKP